MRERRSRPRISRIVDRACACGDLRARAAPARYCSVQPAGAGLAMSETRGQVHSGIGTCLVLAVILQAIPAFSQEVRDEGTNAGEDFFRPPTNLFQVNTQYRTAPGSGPNGTITSVTTG